MQKIGSITIDDTYYPGKDLYSDGEIEDEMLDIAKNVPVSEYNRVIAERKSWAILYHFSNVRENIVQSMPITKEEQCVGDRSRLWSNYWCTCSYGKKCRCGGAFYETFAD